MLNIPNEIKELYRTDVLPLKENLAHKEFRLNFYDESFDSIYPAETLLPEEDLLPYENKIPFLIIENDRIKSETITLTEMLCSDDNLEIGSCESSIFEFVCADVAEDLTGREMVVTLTAGGYEMAFGTYIVKEEKKESDLRFKKIVAYDRMLKFDIDVLNWYNSLSYPITVSELRHSLCKYIGVSVAEQNLINDNMLINKKEIQGKLLGRDVLRAIAEVNGAYGHFERTGLLKFINLALTGLYPSETLYPDQLLYPSDAGEFLSCAHYETSIFEEYIVHEIEKLQIKTEIGTIGAVSGSGKNTYTMSGNILLYGKSNTELQTISDNIYPAISGRFYRPHTTVTLGLPYVEVGDGITITTSDDIIESFIFKRILSGVQCLNDEYSAKGTQYIIEKKGSAEKLEQLENQVEVEKLKNNNRYQSMNQQIEKNADFFNEELKTATGNINKTITSVEDKLSSSIAQTESAITLKVNDWGQSLTSQINITSSEISLEVRNLDKNLSSKITQNATNITAEVTRAKDAESRLQITADGISTTVKNNKKEIESQITQTADGINLTVSNNKKELQSQITQNAKEIVLKVSEKGVVAAINMSPEAIKISANKLQLTGYVTITDLSGTGNTVINGSNITTGTINASKVKVTNIDASSITTGSLDCGLITTNGGYKVMNANLSSLYIGGTSSSYVNNIIVQGSTFETTGSYANIKSTYSTIGKSGGYVGFFGTAPGARRTVTSLTGTSSVSTEAVANKLNSLISAMNYYGLIAS